MLSLKTQVESRLQEAAELCDEVLAGLNFDALYINDNNATDWQDALTKLNAAYDAVKHCQRFDYDDPSERDLEPDEGPRQYERV